MQRSTAVREALVKSFGVDTNRLASGGYGSKYPIASNATQEGKAQNRRVDFVNLSIKSTEAYENELFAISNTN
jgi:outer membrane protein OmpA-like peptidoglycan-associated protein